MHWLVFCQHTRLGPSAGTHGAQSEEMLQLLGTAWGRHRERGKRRGN